MEYTGLTRNERSSQVASIVDAEAPRCGEPLSRIAAVEQYSDRSQLSSTTASTTASTPDNAAPDFALAGRTIALAAPDGIFILDEHRRVTFANPAAERLFGFTFAEFQGRRLHDLLHHTRPDGRDYPAAECPHSRVFITGKPILNHPDTLFRKDGSTIHVLVSVSPVLREGSVDAAVVIIRDNTGEECARRELTETNERLAAALANAELGVWQANFETGEAWWDARMKSMFGLAPDEEITVAKAQSFVHPEDFPSHEEILNTRPEPNGDVQWEWRIIRRDRTIRWHQGRARVTRGADGRAIRAHGVTLDITNVKRAQEYRERLASVVESSEEAIASGSLDGIITSWNRGAEIMFGYSAAEIVGQPATILSPPERAAEVPTILERIQRDQCFGRYETERMTKDRRRIKVLVTFSPMRNESGAITGVSVIVRDITQQKLMEEKLRQAEKMEAVGQLAGGIAHDFNNLLTIVVGSADMALADAPGELLREQLTAIKGAGDRAADLTRRLLAFSRKQILQPEVIDMNDVVHGILPLLKHVIRADIDCGTHLAPSLWSVRADPHQVEEALLNLVINAGDAVGSGGVVSIETKNVELDEEYVRIHPDAARGLYARLAVHDNGPGIAPSIREHIFEPFFTTKPRGKGTGLGLAMVYGITRQSGGHITCDSDPASGTTFAIYLPATGDTSSQRHLTGATGTESLHGIETVLLVEDDDAVRACTARALRSLGYTVHEATGGRDAIALGNMNREALDLLVTDVVMPGMCGPEVAAALRALIPRLRVVYISGYTNDALDVSGTGWTLLPKPFTRKQLASKVRQTLRMPVSSATGS